MNGSKKSRRALAAAMLALAVVTGLALTACGSSDSGGSSGDKVVVGATIPISGELAVFGGYEKWSYEHAVQVVNEEGGVEVDGEKKEIELKLLDDKSNPNTTSANTQRLISEDKVTALLGSCSPPLVNAGAVIADRSRMPMVTACNPLGAFRAVKDWEYAWDIFFDEVQATEVPFQMMEETGVGDETNKRIALLHDNGPDGINFSKLWKEYADKFGYEVVLDASFPENQTSFSSTITKAKSSGAEIVLSQEPPAAAIAIRKTMAAQGYTPKLLVMEKGAEPVLFTEAVGKLSDGVLVAAYWDPSFGYPGSENLAEEFEKETGQASSQHIADGEAAATVLFHAIDAAGSTDPEKINEAIAKTNLETVAGKIEFADDHTATLPSVEAQWQDGKTAIVWPPKDANGKLIFPLP
jgi:branched-chain amino acid transport system substrate-binding protein